MNPEFMKDNYLVKLGVSITLIYFFLLLYMIYPFENFASFINSAPLNEKGDFLAGAFGPVAFLWLVIGYFMQSFELKMQREASISQNTLILNDLELQKRTYDPVFNIEVIESRCLTLKNHGKEARKIIVYHVNHQSKQQQIIAMVNCLHGDHQIEFELKPPLLFPDREGKLAEILIIYNSQLDLIRAQRFGIMDRTNCGNAIGWQIGHAGDTPDYFLKYT